MSALAAAAGAQERCTAASLDGFIATSDDSLAWLFPLADINETSYPEFINNVGALAAIMNAVVDTLSPLGVAHIDMPATPEKAWHTIRAAQAR